MNLFPTRLLLFFAHKTRLCVNRYFEIVIRRSYKFMPDNITHRVGNTLEPFAFSCSIDWNKRKQN